MYGFYQDEQYDLSYTIDDDLIEMTKPLILNCNPYLGEFFVKIQLKKELRGQFLKDHPEIDLASQEDKKSIYTMNFRLLGRILESIQFWNKNYGSDGYLNYLNKFMNGE